MEKDHRLFLRNLSPDIDDGTLQNLFQDYGKVTNVDIKEKIQTDGSRIAFVNLTTTDRQLNTCFQIVNGKLLNGNAIRVEVAKESFLDRLKRERAEAASGKSQEANKQPKVLADQHIERINIKAPANIKTKPTKRIYNFDESDNDEPKENCTEESRVASNFEYDPALQPEEEKPVKKEIKVQEKQIPPKTELKIAKAPEKKAISESEIRRLASVRQKRQAFKAKEQLISHALKAVDSCKNKKIIFSEDIEKIGVDVDKKSKSLFDDNDDDDPADWNDEKFEHDEKRSAKVAMSMNNLGRDKRFLIDDRFLDDDEKPTNTKTPEESGDNELKDETNWQLGILQNVLGKPLKARDEKLSTKNQNKMIRYDPTASDHGVHELEMTSKPVSKAKKRKLKASKAETQEEAPVPVSSEVFYSVSENLVSALNTQEEFSLLKTFGTAPPTDKNKSDDYNATANASQENWQRNFDAKNPFKYESSDDEGPEPTIEQITRKDDHSANSKANNYSIERRDDDGFFSGIGDQQFCDDEEFFKTKPSSAENFNKVRRELKTLMRKKIRNNVRKSTPWRNKKIGRVPKTR